MSEKTIKTMTDSMGNNIPVKYVSAYDKARDRATRRILARFQKARSMLEQRPRSCGRCGCFCASLARD